MSEKLSQANDKSHKIHKLVKKSRKLVKKCHKLLKKSEKKTNNLVTKK